MLMEHFLCDDIGGKHNVCEMKTNVKNFVLLYGFPTIQFLQNLVYLNSPYNN